MTTRRGLGAGAIITIIVAVCCVGGAVAAGLERWLNPSDPTPAAAQPQAPAANPFDQAAFDAYWSGPGVTDHTRQMVTKVDWNGAVLTAHTGLFADFDARDPATVICGALSGYWNLRGEFRPVRVVDGADQILVSRNTAAEACTWRR